MGQSEIIDYLIKIKGEPITLLSLSKNLGITRSNVSRACRILIRNKEVKVQKVKQGSFTRFLIAAKL